MIAEVLTKRKMKLTQIFESSTPFDEVDASPEQLEQFALACYYRYTNLWKKLQIRGVISDDNAGTMKMWRDNPRYKTYNHPDMLAGIIVVPLTNGKEDPVTKRLLDNFFKHFAACEGYDTEAKRKENERSGIRQHVDRYYDSDFDNYD